MTTDDTTPEIQMILAGYAEAARRDTLVEQAKWHWTLGAFCGWGVAAVLGVLLAWQMLTRQDVAAFVQLVQISDTGKVMPLGVPVNVLDYAPEDAQYLEMLGSWLHAVRWRTSDGVLAQAEWQQAYYFTCGTARQVLQLIEKREQPFDVAKTKRHVSVVLESVTKSPVPRAYTALWQEIVVEGTAAPVIERWAGTFTTGRLATKTQAHVIANRLGICVSSFDFSKQPG
jgi:type IV secretion system protein VirB5